MPAPIHVIIITPIGKIPDVLSTLLFNMSAQPVRFTEADPPIRVATHRVLAGGMSVDQRQAIDDFVDANPPIFPSPTSTPSDPGDPLFGVLVQKFTKVLGTPSPEAQMLLDYGLTKLDGSV